MTHYQQFLLVICYFVLQNTIGCADGRSPSSKDVPVSNDTAVSTTETIIKSTTRSPLLQGLRLPCSCLAGQCGCCTGMILERFRQKACVNFTYEPDDFALTTRMTFNGRLIYKRTVSGKNPPPICVPVPRLRFITFCVEFSNIYFANRNMHMCIDAEASWEDFTLVDWSFDCLRLGVNGVAVIGEEEGGGLPPTLVDEEDQTDEDYDDSARNEPLVETSLRNKTKPLRAKLLSNGTILFSLNKGFKIEWKNIEK